jgi:NADH:ubiquinone oxidoreductase subunit 3 (subunit A)
MNLLLTPPVAFIIILLLVLSVAYILAFFAFKPKQHNKGTSESYACGEDTYETNARVDYSQFFAFAFFFTIAHVAAMMLATFSMGLGQMQMIVMGVLYFIAGATCLMIVLGRINQ